MLKNNFIFVFVKENSGFFFSQQAVRRSLQEQLTDEPPADCPEPMTTLRVRLPNGETLIRRFLAAERMQMVLNYLGSKGFNSDNHKVLTTFPKKDVSWKYFSQLLAACIC